jgi:hypothetical protein
VQATKRIAENNIAEIQIKKEGRRDEENRETPGQEEPKKILK